MNVWAGVGAPAAPEDAVGLRYFTITLPDQKSLDEVVARIVSSGTSYKQEAGGVLLSDPFGIGIKFVINN
ncbi:Catechol-2,3-dioxygenase [compost metagenome]